ncbi:MAG: CPBP family intramembrane metalloprotease [Candidatus Eisenbacteria bacterium]|uniref:CPBP family intramembrane metalloprotease n=1 Tax=Eiseniibacteriota bacterium TaxID=2212470 RepID=A0A948RXL0_UNCEI|nr:CPBP family intramembrane metalloprotease [Candidatus Eisenbacteria bacterium]MBU1950538.1 CPBP family intramembrane metalloprotease [Candidatus Eisenbacteria bacterium]MBU2690927.1 CPBP family intramembrane metalloprotease [Candidatus Eisenbacteria bacterium]
MNDHEDFDGNDQDIHPKWHPLARIALYLFVVVGALQLLIGSPAIALWLLLTGQDPNLLLDSEIAGEALLFAYALLAPATVLATIPFLRRLDRRSLREMGAYWPGGRRSVALRQIIPALAATVLFLGLWLFIIPFLSEFQWNGLSDTVRTGPGWWPSPAGSFVTSILFLLGFMVQGGLEEWIVRGYIYANLRDRWSWPNAAAASSLIFALGHGLNPEVSPVSIMNTFLIGLVLAMLVEWTGSLWAATLIHGFWNFFVGCAISLPVSGITTFRILDLSVTGPSFLTGGDYGPEGSLIMTGMLLPLVFVMAHRLDGIRRDIMTI